MIRVEHQYGGLKPHTQPRQRPCSRRLYVVARKHACARQGLSDKALASVLCCSTLQQQTSHACLHTHMVTVSTTLLPLMGPERAEVQRERGSQGKHPDFQKKGRAFKPVLYSVLNLMCASWQSLTNTTPPRVGTSLATTTTLSRVHPQHTTSYVEGWQLYISSVHSSSA